MNAIKTKADAIKYLQSATTGDEILDNLNQLPTLIITDSDDAVSNTMSDEEESETDDTWAPLPEGLFEEESVEDDEDDDISAYTSPYEEMIS